MQYRTGMGISTTGRGELSLVTSRGRRLVTVADVAATLKMDRRTAARKLGRWANQGWLRRVRRGLYIAVPVDAETPMTWTEDALILANAVWSPCYFTGWTAASHWSMTEQVFRTTVLKTSARVRSRKTKLLEHSYRVVSVSQNLMLWGLKSVWRDGVRLSYADPARTVVDILDSPRLGGGIRHAAEILDAYLHHEDPDQLVSCADRLGNRTVFKRLGYLLEVANRGQQRLIDACASRVSAGVSLLDPDAPIGGPRIAKWKLKANVRVTPEEPS